jgi:hypothetical protein
MATRRYSLSAGNTQKDVIEAVGAAVVSGGVELTIDFGAASLSTQEGKTRALLLIEQIQYYIMARGWPPA